MQHRYDNIKINIFDFNWACIGFALMNLYKMALVLPFYIYFTIVMSVDGIYAVSSLAKYIVFVKRLHFSINIYIYMAWWVLILIFWS